MVMYVPPDVVICDLEFPAKSGLTALRELREKPLQVSFVMISLDAGKPMLTGMGSRLVGQEELVRHLASAVRAAAGGEKCAAAG